MNPATVFEIWAEADPDDWNATGNGNGTDYPSDRMLDAAYAVGGSTLLGKYATVASNNGTDR